MLINYLVLLRQFCILLYIKVHKFLKQTAIIHHKYYDFFFTGLFLHLLVKIILYLGLNLQLYGTFNIILLLLSIYISTITNIYDYIYLMLFRFITYVFKYLQLAPIPYLVSYATESETIRLYFPYLYEERPNSENLNKERDRFKIFKPFFLFFFAVRHFILKEPLLFTVIHILIFVNFLQDYNPGLLLVYLFILQFSRILFFLGNPYERFKTKIWEKSFFRLVTRMGVFEEFSELRHLNPNLKYDSKIIQKITINNINLMMYFSLREIIWAGAVTKKPKPGVKLSALLNQIERYDWITFSYYIDIPYTIDNFFYNLCFYVPQLYKDCQRFVQRNEWFWLALFIIIVYSENFVTTVLITISEPVTVNLPIHPIINNIYTLYSFDIVETYTETLRLYYFSSRRETQYMDVILEMSRNINGLNNVIKNITVEFYDPKYLAEEFFPEELIGFYKEVFEIEIHNLETYERPRTWREYINYRVKRRLMWLVACAFYYFMVYVPILLDYLVIAIEYIEIIIEYIKKFIQYFKK